MQKVSGLRVRDRLIVRRNGTSVCILDDLIVTTGLQWIAQRLTGVSSPITHMGIGTGTTGASAGDTALETEIARVALNSPGGTASGVNAVFVGEFTAGVGTGDITEIALFDAASGGTMLCRTVGAAIAKGAGDSLEFTSTIEAGV